MIGIVDKYRENFSSISAPRPNSKSDFFSLVKEKLAEVADQLHESEKVGIAAATNKADLHTLVTTFSVAEANLRMLVTLTEKSVTTIQDITKMQV